MHVTWERTWPRWLAVACTAFGFANVIGALAGPLRFTLPGVVVGSGYAAIGLKRGLPLFASTSEAAVSPSEGIAQGLRNIRRCRLLAFASMVAWLPIAVIVRLRVLEKLDVSVFMWTFSLLLLCFP